MSDISPTTILVGDCLSVLRTLPAESVNCCVTSPPYYGLRSYNGGPAEIGLEPTPAAYVARLVEVFREVRRVLRSDGTCWINLGDSYATQGGPQVVNTINADRKGGSDTQNARQSRRPCGGLKPKDLIGIPWRVAFALQEDGWYLRCDIVWAKDNAMPESVTDRPTRAHEFIFLLSKAERYHYDAEAIKEPRVSSCNVAGPNSRANRDHVPRGTLKQDLIGKGTYTGFNERWSQRETDSRNKRSVWNVSPRPFPGAHFATYPPELIRPCILAGCPVGGVVLDPFCGAGTTGVVCSQTGRNFLGIELNPDYARMARRRIADTTPAMAGLWER